MTPMVLFVYGFMISLPMFSQKLIAEKELHPILKYTLPLLLIVLFSIIPMFIIGILRPDYLWLFPPPNFIPL